MEEGPMVTGMVIGRQPLTRDVNRVNRLELPESLAAFVLFMILD